MFEHCISNLYMLQCDSLNEKRSFHLRDFRVVFDPLIFFESKFLENYDRLKLGG